MGPTIFITEAMEKWNKGFQNKILNKSNNKPICIISN